MTPHLRRARAPFAVAVATIALVAIFVSTAAGATAAMPSKSAKIATTPYTMPTSVPLADTAPPWPLPEDAEPYIKAAGLSVLSEEQLQVHYHVHLDIIDDTQDQRRKVTVPQGIGFLIEDGKATGITVLHTHDTSGIVHIESAKAKAYALGQVFTEWGVALGADQVGGLRADGANVVRAYVNGKPFAGDPATIRLRKHLEIALWYGPADATPKVPKSYRFPAGQ